MRSARLVGPGPDGTSLILADEDGEELAVALDDRLRAAVRHPGPRPRPLETTMDTPLSPRDIQMRIRAGETLEDVTGTSGLSAERVERFAAPVLAEREHVALTALACPVRRRGETSGHRLLRATVAERLLKRGVDVDTIDWDAYRLEDGRWALTAAYALAEADQRATFTFDLRGRFTVAADDPARWLIGEEAAPPAGRGRGPDQAGNEPTVDLSDELALVRVVQDAAPAPEPAPDAPAPDAQPDDAQPDDDRDLPPVRSLRSVPEEQSDRGEPESEEAASDQPNDEEGAEDSTAPEPPRAEDESELSALYAMLGSDGYSEDSPRVYGGLSDASAVPETTAGGWEAAAAVDYPVEPSPAEEDEQSTTEEPEPDQASKQVAGADQPDSDHGASPGVAHRAASSRADQTEFQLEEAPPAKPVKRKRASVPSWDEIMFGGPKPPG